MIRFRVDGILHNYLELPLSDYPAVASRIKLIGNLNIAESRLPQDGRTNFQLGSYDIDIRISTIPVMKGESIVMRLLRKDSMHFDLSELGMSSEMKS
jgi:type II secretory ATPase GspE/PulE/Tfp pilus assembly ATPase PilB-like protein